MKMAGRRRFEIYENILISQWINHAMNETNNWL
jgi:hypothetical protein